jgi:hypothetical protein
MKTTLLWLLFPLATFAQTTRTFTEVVTNITYICPASIGTNQYGLYQRQIEVDEFLRVDLEPGRAAGDALGKSSGRTHAADTTSNA